jgi:hypothetical protein
MYLVPLYLLISVASFAALDRLLLPTHNKQKARWFLLHAIGNSVVIILTINDTVSMLSTVDPLSIAESSHSVWPSVIVFALHIYHAIGYRLNFMDVLHHVVMLVILLMPLIHSNDQLFVGFTNFALFFLCGLPGGIDYYCMYCVEQGLMKRAWERYINVGLNFYIRSIGILYGAFMCYQSWLMGIIAPGYAFPVLIAFIWNAQFFSSLVAIAYGRSTATDTNTINDDTINDDGDGVM